MGFDYVTIETEDAAVASTLYVLRGEALFGSWRAGGSGASLYLLGGAAVISEDGLHDATGLSESVFVYGLSVGLGAAAKSGAWDLRAVYSLYPSSTNVTDNMLVAAGVSF